MKLRRAGLLVLVILSLVLSSVAAQEDEGEPQTIEELYLSQEIELQIIRSQALASGREMKQLALQGIRNMVESGTLTEGNERVLIVLDALASEGTSRVVREGGMVVNNYPDVRREAVELLGEVGGEAARNTLLEVVIDDPEPMVVSSAIYGLGLIAERGGDAEAITESAEYIAWVLRSNTMKAAPDNNLAFASLLSLERLAAASADPLGPEVVTAIIEVASANYIRSVRLKALMLLETLRDGSESDDE